MTRRALLIEGGGMKSAYANGVLSSWQDAEYCPWDAVYGNSAGGALAAWHAAGQCDTAEKTWAYSRDKRVLSYGRAFRGKPFLDHDALIRIVYEEDHPLDIEAVRAAKHEVRVVVADADNGATVYPDIREGPPEMVLLWIKATGRIPLGSNGPVEVNGRRYLDGGCTDPIPVQRMIDDGATTIDIILNQPPGVAQKDNKWFLRRAGKKFPALADSIMDHVAHKAEAWELMHNPPEGVEINVLHPKEPTGLLRLDRDLDNINRALRMGKEDGLRWLEQR